ncbi:CPCC family cysteine-rich protein [Acinetobacter gyllenbergii]|uniref:CPCC family cysteine-rich protein n=1 Tax=Acinetobacter gyllenbergii TaxID=134534 RepID=UPI0009D68925
MVVGKQKTINSGGTNVPSLNQACKNFKKYGAMEERFIKNVRKLKDEEISED